MDFFILRQDERIANFAEPVGVSKLIDCRMVQNGDLQFFDQTPVQFYIKEKEESEYLDFIEAPIPLISERLKQMIQDCEWRIFYKPVLLAEVKQLRQEIYWLIVPDKIDCLSDATEFNKDHSIKKLVIAENKVGYSKLFKVGNILEDLIVVDLDIAEKILDSGFSGIKLQRVASSGLP